ncbi:LacI family DNA-binding transcriptional regulator [Inquilinus limosus]|uniref:LacI family DNA-binding transcriptional regulator n=1 Tax=Inquilinus limosus TaxID=171674 RepID=UPI00126A6DD6|nr:LacI family DNA-binding transcriptional regulator [Inquilinus limosus]
MKAISIEAQVSREDQPKGQSIAEIVANRAKVSRAAVSRAFNPKAPLRADKRELVLRIAEEMNYVPNMAGRALATQRSHLVGVIVPHVCSPWESLEIDALTTALQDRGFATLLFKTQVDRSLDPKLLSYMRAYNPDSVVVFTENVPPDQLHRAFDQAVPVYVDYPDEASDPGPLPESGMHRFDCLRVLQRDGIEQAVALLSGFGRRRFAYLAGNPKAQANTARLRTLQQVLAARGLPPAAVAEGDFSYQRGHDATIELFRAGPGAEAVFAANDVSAFGALDALRQALGRRVPEDVSVVGFDDIDQAAWRSYDLTTIKIDVEERVAALVRLILQRLQNRTAPPMTETIRTKLVVRSTVG